MTFVLDHFVVCCERLDEGVAHVEAALGVPMAAGGRHAAMGTHNRLLSLGGELYLEVIAIDPDAPPPGRARWFELDRFAGPPRLTNWVVRHEDLAHVAANAPPGVGRPMTLSRGDLRWTMLVPEDGRLPFDGAHPAVLTWEGTARPADYLPDSGCRLGAATIGHPRIADLTAAVTCLFSLPGVSYETAPEKTIRLEIDTPRGRRSLT